MRLFLVLAAAGAACSSFAWDLNGHRIVGEIGYMTAKPATRKWVDQLLGEFKPNGVSGYETLAEAACMADDYKRPRFEGFPKDQTWSPWHYLNYDHAHAPRYVLEPDDRPDNNVIWGLVQTVNGAKGQQTAVSERGKAWCLAMAAHFVGDIHQPLHCTARNNDRGGNDFKLLGPGTVTNLHILWDVVASEVFDLPEAPTRAKIQGVARRLMSLNPKPAKSVLTYGPTAWSHESFDAAVAYAYPNALVNQKQTPEYLAVWKKVGLARMTLAGYRLGALLDALAAKG